MTLWKATERALAKRMGGTRVPITGRQRGSAPDIQHDAFAIEVKTRKALPSWLRTALAQAKACQRSPLQLPIVLLHEKGQRRDRTVVLMTLDEFENFNGRVRAPARPTEE